MFGAHGMCIPTVSSLQSFEFYIRAFTRTANGKNEPFTVFLSSLFAVVRNFCICCVSKKNSHFSVRPIRGFEIRSGIRYTFCYSRLPFVNLVLVSLQHRHTETATVWENCKCNCPILLFNELSHCTIHV